MSADDELVPAPADRGKSGSFLQGHGVKGGRLPGPSRTERVAQALEPHLPAVLAKAVELALLVLATALPLYASLSAR